MDKTLYQRLCASGLMVVVVVVRTNLLQRFTNFTQAPRSCRVVPQVAHQQPADHEQQRFCVFFFAKPSLSGPHRQASVLLALVLGLTRRKASAPACEDSSPSSPRRCRVMRVNELMELARPARYRQQHMHAKIRNNSL